MVLANDLSIYRRLLRFARPENQRKNTSRQQNNPNPGWKFLAGLCLHADPSVSDLHTVVLAPRNRHHQR